MSIIFKGADRIRRISWGMILLLSVLSLWSCSDDDDADERSGWVRVLPLDLSFNSSGGTKEVYLVVTKDVELSGLHCSVAQNGQDWCTLELVDNLLKVTVDPTYYEEPRATVVTLSYGELTREIPVSQEASSGSADVKITVSGATATTEEVESEQRGIVCSFDGDYTSYFNSKFGAFTDWPFQITYTLENCTSLNYIIYHPRTDNGTKYGAFNKFDVLVSTAAHPEFVKVKSFELETNYTAASILQLDEAIKDVKKVRFDIHAAHNNRISCAEMEFFQTSNNKYDYLQIFTDNSCSELREGITEKDIKKMPGETYKKLATALLTGTYNSEFRVAEYRPYQNPSIMATTNKTGPYSLRDNPTGIYVEQGEEILVLVGDTHGQNISMVVQDLSLGYNSSKSYPLLSGENKLKMAIGGLVYIQNLTNDKNIPLILKTEEDKKAVAAKSVKVHFPFGKVNGYFDAQTGTQAQFEEMLRNAKWLDLDVLGKYVHVTWTVLDYKQANTPIMEVMNLLDEVVRLEWDMMGLFKYNKEFGNRMYLHIEHNAKNPYSASNHTAYLASYRDVFCTVEGMKNRVWVLGHEIGHANQTRPGLKWAGLTEVTNNILANYVRTSLGKGSRLMDKDTGITVYEEAINRIVKAGQPHCLKNASDEYYVKLVPFWQLKLYLTDVLGKEDFYRDLHEYYRVTPDLDTTVDTQGILQLDFVRQVCNLAQLDLLDFFEKWGFLRPVDIVMNDYGDKHFTVTETQIQALRKEIEAKEYPKAPENLYLITDENVNDYK